MSLESEIREVLNKHSIESSSDTPDYILAQFMLDCLEAFDKAVNRREDFFRVYNKYYKDDDG